MRLLTKSRFKLATECPTKLFYTHKKDEYADQALDDAFLEALAEGGFQVGELAKAMNPGGRDIKSLGYDESLAETNELLKQEKATVYEAAVKYKNLFIRIDVLRKDGNVFDLVEVKAKSFDDEGEFIAKRTGKVSTPWKPYLIDVAFQDYVLRKAFPGAIVRPYLMLTNKNAHTSVDGLNQKFKIIRSNGNRKEARMVGDCSPEALGDPVLIEVDVREYVKELQSDHYPLNGELVSFEEYIRFLAKKYEADEKIPPKIDCKVCKACSFKTKPADEAKGLKSGYKECWKQALNFTDDDFQKPSVLDIWNFRKKQAFLRNDRFFLRDLNEMDFDPEKPTQARQWLQVQKTVANDTAPWVDKNKLQWEMESWTWPLHFIDFETSAVAIPFNAGRRPYEVVAFQFSHHMAHEDGRIEHVGEYINVEPGEFPNFDFLRALKADLDKDEGAIFRYAAHENTVLNHIARQLAESDEPDRDELIEWVKSITHNTATGWIGPRSMVDLLQLVKDCYYQLDMGGSNSIKQVLPAVLNSSDYLQQKYAEPVYNSGNFTDQVWIQRDENGRVKDPYKLLPPVFQDVSQDDLEKIETDGELADGGAAMTAYARLQFSDVSEAEREAVRQALLRYCELDTLAMVMIWEAWREVVSESVPES
jgi:hypothetical protein